MLEKTAPPPRIIRRYESTLPEVSRVNETLTRNKFYPTEILSRIAQQDESETGTSRFECASIRFSRSRDGARRVRFVAHLSAACEAMCGRRSRSDATRLLPHAALPAPSARGQAVRGFPSACARTTGPPATAMRRRNQHNRCPMQPTCDRAMARGRTEDAHVTCPVLRRHCPRSAVPRQPDLT